LARSFDFAKPHHADVAGRCFVFRSPRRLCYAFIMTAALDKAIATVRKLLPEQQDDLARLMLQLAGEDLPTAPLTADEEASFDLSLAQEARGEFASESRIRSIWATHGL
jgi:hypothetical protein